MRDKKGMSAALTLVIAAVILIVVAVLLLSLTSGGLGKLSVFSKKNTDIYLKKKSECMTCVSAYCAGHPSASLDDATSFCDSCSGLSVTCSGGEGGSDSCSDLLMGKCELSITGGG